jgi:hypothetical protein
VTHQADFFLDIGVPMESPLDPMPLDQMPSPERIIEVLATHQMKLIENPFDQ